MRAAPGFVAKTTLAVACALAVGHAASAAPLYGVNVHLDQGDSEARIIAATEFLKVKNLRDHAIGPKTGPEHVAAIYDLAARGYHFDFITGGDLTFTVAQLHKLEGAHPGSITAVEGPNEINNFEVRACPGLAHNSPRLRACVLAYQKGLYAAVKGDPKLAKIPVLAFTDNPYPAGLPDMDSGNVHYYPSKIGAMAGFPFMSRMLAKSSDANPDRDLWITETGFNLASGFTQEEQAAALQAELPKLAALNVRAVYVYQLLDNRASWGLFNPDGSPRPAAVVFAKFIAGR